MPAKQRKGPAPSLLYELVKYFFNMILDIFFREIRPRGAHKIPLEGPVIFVAAPHANQFIDPLIVLRECKRQVSFLIAEKSMHQRGVGQFARALHAIPVIRPQDLAKPGAGRIHLLNVKTDPLTIHGKNTKFTQQLRPRDTISLPKGVGYAEVVAILSDTELRIKKEFKDLKALELLTSPDGSAYKCQPHVEQESVYREVHKQLAIGGAIAIFPEGGSHDRQEMLPLKAGVTIMALGTMAAFPNTDVKIVPCGLNYFHPHKFRSRAVIEFGNPISIPKQLVDDFVAGGTLKRDACAKLLDQIYNALKSVTVNATSYETLMVIQAARRLYKPAHRSLPISTVVDLNRRFVLGYETFKHEPRVIELQRKVMAYNQLLKYHGLKDHQVNTTKLGGARAMGLFWYRVMWLLLWGLLAFPGGILNLPAVIVARLVSHKKQKEALAGSTVKIAGRDVIATWKVLIAMGLVPLQYGVYSIIVFALTIHYQLRLTYVFWLPLLTWNMLPFISYASMRFAENGLDVYRSLRPLFLSLMDPTSVENLRNVRNRLSDNLTDLINEYGPKIFPDFDPSRLSRGGSVAPRPQGEQSNGLSPTLLSTGNSNSNSTTSMIQLAEGFLSSRLEWLDDKLFFLTRSEDTDQDGASTDVESIGGPASLSMDNARGALSNGTDSYGFDRSRSGSRPGSRVRSRTNSWSSSLAGGGMEGFKVAAMTELDRGRPLKDIKRERDHATMSTAADTKVNGNDLSMRSRHRQNSADGAPLLSNHAGADGVSPSDMAGNGDGKSSLNHARVEDDGYTGDVEDEAKKTV
ncbi:hypothetical protein BZG36_03684 [Bifiguratus adelaidae]|uniref:Phospholipid/glycerol acyltransferase domain-containing protein n=1 Tax=Bifiguratus adelaidae TaxID=1938954 RepID=A0A261XZV4_9FUNG|nr:hypothetical protein BZG36_03684 [Bifiguratus adelaidae]